MTRTGDFQFVRHSKIEKFERDGWMIVDDLGPLHGRWSVLMWRCDCFEAGAVAILKNQTRNLHHISETHIKILTQGKET